MQENIKSYNSIYQLRQAFVRSGGHSDAFAGNFNRLDLPGNFYFRIFFHFNTGHGLLNIGNEFMDQTDRTTEYSIDTNTALNYLFMNGEYQRMQLLNDFVSLLSNINTYSPWHFQQIEGLQEALQRTEYTGEFKIEEEPRSITIKCMEDSYDNRIATLLDLYKSVAFSRILHKEILPANLRRFDMSIYIINTPISGVHYGYGEFGNIKEELGLSGSQPQPLGEITSPEVLFRIPEWREWKNGSNNIFASAKLIEFQGCEIDANSSASGYQEVKNDEPFQMKHDIRITFKNVVEQRFNDSLNEIIGDLIFDDLDRLDRESSDNPWRTSMPYNASAFEALTNDIESDDPFYIEPEDNSELLTQFMQDTNNRSVAIEGKTIGASSAMDPTGIPTNGMPGAGNLQISTKTITTPQNLVNNFINGVTGTVQNRVSSILSRIQMGNLYWGNLTDPLARINAGQLGSNLVNKTLDNTVGKVGQRIGGSLKSIKNQVQTDLRGWAHGSSIGQKL